MHKEGERGQYRVWAGGINQEIRSSRKEKGEAGNRGGGLLCTEGWKAMYCKGRGVRAANMCLFALKPEKRLSS